MSYRELNVMPLVSVITVVFNGKDGIRETIESVIPQLCTEVEYIIIDGGSLDGTVDIIREYEDHLTYWTSEPDKGIYDAMNKGILLSKGRFVCHLNVGDSLIYIPKEYLRNLSNEIGCAAFPVQLANGKLFFPKLGVASKFRNTLHHQGCFYSRTKIGLYDTGYKVYSDFDKNCELINSGSKVVIGEKVVALHQDDGVSNKPGSFHEVYSIVNKRNGIHWVIVTFVYYKLRGIKYRLGVR